MKVDDETNNLNAFYSFDLKFENSIKSLRTFNMSQNEISEKRYLTFKLFRNGRHSYQDDFYW